MIGTLLRIHWINLSRDRVGQMLSFVVPAAFFTIFALVFGNANRGGTGRIHVAVVDESHTAVSARLVRALKAEKGMVAITRART
jgi:ABC-2 type transport system permease protein